MRKFLLLSLLLAPAALAQVAAPADAPLGVLSFKWAKSRQVVSAAEAQGTVAPAAAMIPQNKNFARNARVNDPAGVRDPNLDTIDGRREALERNVQEARAPKQKPVDGYSYSARVRNTAAQTAEVVFWEYEFADTADEKNVTRRQFLCGAQLKPGKEKELLAFSLSPPSGVVSATSLADKSASPFRERVIVNRVEYADGTIWQRTGWNFAEVKAAVARVTATPWGAEVCRAL